MERDQQNERTQFREGGRGVAQQQEVMKIGELYFDCTSNKICL